MDKAIQTIVLDSCIVSKIFAQLGEHLNQDKTIGPTTNLTFLDIVIDTVKMQVMIPVIKVLELKLLSQHARER